jgi:hypothetical protein
MAVEEVVVLLVPTATVATAVSVAIPLHHPLQVAEVADRVVVATAGRLCMVKPAVAAATQDTTAVAVDKQVQHIQV